MEYSKEDLMEAKKQILGVGENMGTEESKKSGDRPLRTLDFIGYRGVCPQKRVQVRGSKIPIDG